MDKIQKVLIKAGRKDLAEEYYNKIAAGNSDTFPCPECGTKVLENTGYCLKCKKKVKGDSKEAAGNSATFPCPECGTKVLENTGYCLKCKKKVEK